MVDERREALRRVTSHACSGFRLSRVDDSEDKMSLPAGGLIIRDIQVVQDSGAAVLLLRAELPQLLYRFAQSTASDHIQDTYSAASTTDGIQHARQKQICGLFFLLCLAVTVLMAVIDRLYNICGRSSG